jgi:KEOPS complex subunit Cgi121
MEYACDIRTVSIEIHDEAAFLETVRSIARSYNTHIIFFDADKMAGKNHVESALVHAIRAVNGNFCISNSLEMEALLYAAGSRQCINGVAFGIHAGHNNSYLCICPPETEALGKILSLVTPVHDNWETISPEKAGVLKNLFDITSQELGVTGISRLQELVLERVALLEVYR